MRRNSSIHNPQSAIRNCLALAALLASILVAAQSAHATIYYWDNNGSTLGFGTAGGTWGSSANWTTDGTGGTSPSVVSTTTSDDVNFGNGAAGLGAGTVSVTGTAQGFGTMTFASGSGAITISGGTNLDLAASSTITVNNASNTISTPLAGSGSALTKTGNGTLTLSGTNTYTGATTINQGTLLFSNTNTASLPSGSATTINATGTLQYNNAVSPGNVTNPAISLNGGTFVYNTTTAGNRYSVWSGAVTVDSTSVLNLTGSGTSGSNLYFDGGLKGSAALTINASANGGTGLVLRNANSTYSGSLTVNGIASTGNGAAGSGLSIGNVGTNASLPNATITVNGTMDLGNQNTGGNTGIGWANGSTSVQTFQMDGLNGTGVVIANMQTAGSTRIFSVGNNDGPGNFSGTIANGVNNTLSFIKNGSGTQELSGANTYSGVTNVNQGTLLVNGTHIVAGAGVPGLYTVANGATLGGNGSTEADVTVLSGGKLAPGSSPGDLGTGDLLLSSGSIFEVNIDGLTPGTLYDQVDVTGTVNLTGSLLDIILGFSPSYGNTFTIIDNDSTDAVVGTFSGKPEGSLFFDDGQQWKITYVGGSGNDVVLEAVPEPSAYALGLVGLVALACRAWGRKRGTWK